MLEDSTTSDQAKARQLRATKFNDRSGRPGGVLSRHDLLDLLNTIQASQGLWELLHNTRSFLVREHELSARNPEAVKLLVDAMEELEAAHVADQRFSLSHPSAFGTLAQIVYRFEMLVKEQYDQSPDDVRDLIDQITLLNREKVQLWRYAPPDFAESLAEFGADFPIPLMFGAGVASSAAGVFGRPVDTTAGAVTGTLHARTGLADAPALSADVAPARSASDDSFRSSVADDEDASSEAVESESDSSEELNVETDAATVDVEPQIVFEESPPVVAQADGEVQPGAVQPVTVRSSVPRGAPLDPQTGPTAAVSSGVDPMAGEARNAQLRRLYLRDQGIEPVQEPAPDFAEGSAALTTRPYSAPSAPRAGGLPVSPQTSVQSREHEDYPMDARPDDASGVEREVIRTASPGRPQQSAVQIASANQTVPVRAKAPASPTASRDGGAGAPEGAVEMDHATNPQAGVSPRESPMAPGGGPLAHEREQYDPFPIMERTPLIDEDSDLRAETSDGAEASSNDIGGTESSQMTSSVVQSKSSAHRRTSVEGAEDEAVRSAEFRNEIEGARLQDRAYRAALARASAVLKGGAARVAESTFSRALAWAVLIVPPIIESLSFLDIIPTYSLAIMYQRWKERRTQDVITDLIIALCFIKDLFDLALVGVEAAVLAGSLNFLKVLIFSPVLWTLYAMRGLRLPNSRMQSTDSEPRRVSAVS